MARERVVAYAARPLRMATLALALSLLVVSACARSGAASGAQPSSSPSPTGVAKWTQAAASFPPTQTPIGGQLLPAFSDWRAAYFGADGVLHAVTLDGQTDIAGPRLPGLSMYGLNFASAGFAPDGHTLAYAANSLSIVDVSNGNSMAGRSVATYKMYWSPDGSQIALGDNEGGFAIAHAASGVSRVVPGTRPDWYRVLDGWIDATHILIEGVPEGGGTFALAALDIGSGQLRQIATFPIAQNVDYFVTLAPDGREALFYSQPYRDYPFTPTADVIDAATGAVRALPRIAPLTTTLWGAIVWRPGSHTFAFTSDQLGAPTWLVNLDSDSATSVALYQSIGGVEGWSPDGTTLIFSTGYQRTVGFGPYTITAVRLASDGGVSRVTVLTHSAMSFPFVGFVRTA